MSLYNEKYQNNWFKYCPDEVVQKYLNEPLMIDVLRNYGGTRKHGGSSKLPL